ncbi:MAG: hypothetical protein ICV51_05090 [Flavisolibacter sp.]|nr:hypothetical protein [Flavisolibacter sp.]
MSIWRTIMPGGHLKHEIKPHLKCRWCIGTTDAAFIAQMEKLLWRYAPPYEERYAVVCLDEGPVFS